jgi:hypothetical protein
MLEMVTTSNLEDDDRVNDPSVPVVVADFVPLPTTVAPITGCLSELLKTRPVIVV